MKACHVISVPSTLAWMPLSRCAIQVATHVTLMDSIVCGSIHQGVVPDRRHCILRLDASGQAPGPHVSAAREIDAVTFCLL